MPGNYIVLYEDGMFEMGEKYLDAEGLMSERFTRCFKDGFNEECDN